MSSDAKLIAQIYEIAPDAALDALAGTVAAFYKSGQEDSARELLRELLPVFAGGSDE